MRGKCYMLARIVIHLRVLGERLVLIVRIVVIVFLQIYNGFLEMRYV